MCLQDVANAVGAALGTVGGSVDYIVNLAEIKDELKVAPGVAGLSPAELEREARDMALKRGRENAKNIVINNKGTYIYTGQYYFIVLCIRMQV